MNNIKQKNSHTCTIKLLYFYQSIPVCIDFAVVFFICFLCLSLRCQIISHTCTSLLIQRTCFFFSGTIVTEEQKAFHFVSGVATGSMFFLLNLFLFLLYLQNPEPLKYLQHHDPYTFNINLFVSLKGTAQTGFTLAFVVRACVLTQTFFEVIQKKEYILN